MFKLEVDTEVYLELSHYLHVEDAFTLINKNRELFRTWLIWVDDVHSIEDEKAFIKTCLERYANGSLVNCMIFYKNQLVGNIELSFKEDYGIQKGELGYWLASAFHGKGIMHRAAQKMLEIGFEKYQLDKVNLRCAIQNERSCNVAEKLGMLHEGRHRSDIRINDVVMDIDMYSILKDQYQERKCK
jgi:ribosomal-protein-serine acetyltransferase